MPRGNPCAPQPGGRPAIGVLPQAGRNANCGGTDHEDTVTTWSPISTPKRCRCATPAQIRLYGPDAFEGMRKACALTARCLDELVDIVKPGVPTETIDRFVFEFGMDHGALPATLNYRGYTKSSCTSINHVVCHGIPDAKPMREGDILNIDVTYILDGWHGDSSRMYPVGQIKRAAERLLEVTHECLMRGIAAVKPGVRTGAIGAAIQQFRRSRALLGRARLLRTRRGPAVSRRAQYPALRQRPRGGRDARRHDLHHRTDDQSRPAACEGSCRWLDGSDPRPVSFGAIRTHHRRDGGRVRDLFAVPRRAGPTRTCRRNGLA